MRLALLLASVTAFAAVTGTITNQTTGKPQGGATVTLYKIEQAGPGAMTSVKTAANGSFSIPDEVRGGPHMVQAAYDGVTYTRMLPPGRPTTDISLDVYQSSKKPGEAKIATHMVLLEANGQSLNVSESFIWENPGKLAFNDPDRGTLQFYLPPAAKKASVRATAPNGMPIERAAEKTATEYIYKVDFPIKPGKTEFEVAYSMPMMGPGVLNGKLLHQGRTHLIVPQGMAAEGEALKQLGQHPESGASVYEFIKPEYKLNLDGIGSLRGPAGPEDDENAGLQQVRPRLYDRFLWVLGLVAVILGLGMALLYRKQ